MDRIHKKLLHVVDRHNCFNRSEELTLLQGQIEFKVNGDVVKVDQDKTGPDISLARFLRQVLNLTGTKISCNQGGCGACVVEVTSSDPNTGSTRTRSVNACLTPVLSCDGWDITTIEGLGSEKRGLHPLQQKMNDHKGSQCGFCTSGMIMAMSSLLDAKAGPPTPGQVEKALDGNLCRCTGYRPILDAFKSMCNNENSDDIEDLALLNSKCCKAKTSLRIPVIMWSKEGVSWYKPNSLNSLLALVGGFPQSLQYKLVMGNTSKGVYDEGPFQAYVDLQNVPELHEKRMESDHLTVGGSVSLAELIQILRKAGTSGNPGYSYGQAVADHLEKVANSNVRNSGSIAGNLMLKHQHPEFPSDIFLILEALGATVHIVDACNSKVQALEAAPSTFLNIGMSRKVITRICWPCLDPGFHFRSFKVMARRENAHAIVNAAFLLNLSDELSVRQKPRLVFAGIADKFIHAEMTETLMNGTNLLDAKSMIKVLETLHTECKPNPGLYSQQYRQNLAVNLLYKAILGILGERLDPTLRSGATSLARGVSSGRQSYSTNPDLFPINQPINKIEGAVQCTGEAQFLDDVPHLPRELHGAFVLSTLAKCELDMVDPSPALALEGVVAYIDHNDIPGKNSCNRSKSDPEEILSSGKIMYAGQAIGLILAETPDLAVRAARLVRVSYRNIQPPVVSLRKTIEPGLTQVIESEDYVEVFGEFSIGSQYHFHMETQCCIVQPIENAEFNVISSTQWMDKVQLVIAQALAIPDNKVNISVRRLGGAYGAKISRANQIGAACAVAASQLNRPIRIVMDLRSNMEMVGKRLPYHAQYTLKSDKTGLLQDVNIKLFCDCGCNTNESTGPDAATFTQNCYNAKWNVVPEAVTTDTAANTFCRAPGTTQGHAIIENAIEHLALALNIDPVELRLKNMLKAGDPLIGGGSFEGPNPLPDIITQLKATCDYDTRQKMITDFNQNNRWKKRGMALVPCRYPHAIPTTRFYSKIVVCHADGSVAVSHGGIEMGQGINTKVAQVVAKEFGIPVSSVSVKPSNTFTSPNTTATDASNGTECVCSATKIACEKLKERMAPFKSSDSMSWVDQVHKSYRGGVDLTSSYMGNNVNDKLPSYDIWGAVVSEVEVDVLTGERNIIRCDIIEDTGTSVNPALDVGQVEGGFVMSLGLWTTEEIKFDDKTGQILTFDTWDYKPPSCTDIPEDFRLTFFDSKRNPDAFLGAKATGEPCMLLGVSVLFAIRNALKSSLADEQVDPKQWFQLDGPASVERIQLASGTTFSSLYFKFA